MLPALTDASLQTRRLVVGAGKDRRIYVLDRDRMGKFNASRNNIYQQIDGALAGGVFSVPAYFDNTVYFGAVGDAIKAFPISGARLASTPSSRTATAFVYPGATASISANGLSDAILWAVQNTSPAVLSAYDARNLARELYNSNQAPERDQFGAGNKFITPTSPTAGSMSARRPAWPCLDCWRSGPGGRRSGKYAEQLPIPDPAAAAKRRAAIGRPPGPGDRLAAGSRRDTPAASPEAGR